MPKLWDEDNTYVNSLNNYQRTLINLNSRLLSPHSIDSKKCIILLIVTEHKLRQLEKYATEKYSSWERDNFVWMQEQTNTIESIKEKLKITEKESTAQSSSTPNDGSIMDEFHTRLNAMPQYQYSEKMAFCVQFLETYQNQLSTREGG